MKFALFGMVFADLGRVPIKYSLVSLGNTVIVLL